jgi:hypothetical protein
MKAIRRTLLKICADLWEADERLAQICKTLPEPTAEFDALGELRGTLECVRTDLLQDAVSTLREAAKRGCEAEWRCVYEQRVQLLAEVDREGARC